jgi:mRNA interferase HicA
MSGSVGRLSSGEAPEPVKKFTGLGCILARHGGKHDWYQNPETGVSQSVSRHHEIADTLAKHIIKKLGS